MSKANINDEAFEVQKEVLAHFYPGKYVIFQNGELKGIFRTREEAEEEAIKRAFDGGYSIRRVGKLFFGLYPTTVVIIILVGSGAVSALLVMTSDLLSKIFHSVANFFIP